jgi:hypothetical protein
MSQDFNTKDYIIVFNENQYLENYCVKCEKYFTNVNCSLCQMDWLKENFTNWTSENKQLDNLIQEKQLSINGIYDTIFEWIPYYQFSDIEKLNNITYLAKWKDGPLLYNYYYKNKYIRKSANKAIILKYLVNLQNITNEFLNEVSKFSTNLFSIFIILISFVIID